VEPRPIPVEVYIRVEVELKELVAAGKLSKEDAQRKLVAMQNANTKAHIEASVKSGEMTRAEADKLYKELGFK
jgi:polyhydroxyalkanoate synthesis regulator phasin